jgi:hypothetical protein
MTCKRLMLAILIAVRDGSSYEKEPEVAAVNSSGKYARSVLVSTFAENSS